MAQKTAVLLDFDGTIMDTNQAIINSWHATFRELEGRDGDEDVILATFGETLEDSMRHMFPDVPVERSRGIYRDYQAKHLMNQIDLFPGIRELLDTLADRGIRMGLATSRLKATTMQALETFDLNRYFECVITADDITKHKPDPQIAYISMERLGVSPEETLMMGDTMYDVLCARNAGITSVLAGWSLSLGGKSMQDFAPGEAPDYILQDPMELLGLL